MAKDYCHLKLEVEFDRKLMNPLMTSFVERLFKEAGSKLVAQAALLADPDAMRLTFEEWTPEGYRACEPVDVTE